MKDFSKMQSKLAIIDNYKNDIDLLVDYIINNKKAYLIVNEIIATFASDDAIFTQNPKKESKAIVDNFINKLESKGYKKGYDYETIIGFSEYIMEKRIGNLKYLGFIK